MSPDTLVLLLAIWIELVFGDPVSRWHPVAMFGRGVDWIVRQAPADGAGRQLVYGGAAVAMTVTGVAASSAFLLWAVEGLASIAAVIFGAVLFKSSFSYRQLEDEALTVGREIEAGRLAGARTALRALVSRDTDELTPDLAVSAAIESLAENLCDSVVAPLFYFLIFGVPGALAYRAINTWDAMVGYHGRYEYLGRVAARLDDVANFVPARITVALLVLVAPLARTDAGQALAEAWSAHRRTESPNAGWPMAAMAGALRVRLEKPGHYSFGDRFPWGGPIDVARAARVARWTAGSAVALTLLGIIARNQLG